MENNYVNPTTIFDLSLIGDFFSGIDRQGPGGERQTLQALDFMELPSQPRIADLGCGTGGQTVTLARHTNGHITAVDLLPEIFEGLKQRIKNENLSDCITPVHGSMCDLTFSEASLDVIWAEGSIYNIGFERGMREWKKYLKKDGYVAVTETCWLMPERPDDVSRITTDHPEIDDISAKIRIIESLGYQSVAHFILPPECWWENFYNPMQRRIEEYRRLRGSDAVVGEFLKGAEDEIHWYRRFGRYYGYVFFIARNV